MKNSSGKILDSTWSKIHGFPNYSVTKDGIVRNDIRGTIKKTRTNRKGYDFVDLYNDGKRTRKRIHRLVMETFAEPDDKRFDINHKDGNKQNNNISNLEWCTKSENMQHAYNMGLAKPSYGMRGKQNPNAGRHGKRIRIVETGEEFESSLECEKRINGNNRHINDCLRGRQQTHRGYHFEYC